MLTKIESTCIKLDQLSQQKGKAKGKGVAGTVRDTVHLQKEALRKNSHQPTERTTSASPTDSEESSDDDNNDGGRGWAVGERQRSVVGRKRANNEANEAVASTKRKTPQKGNSDSDSFESPER